MFDSMDKVVGDFFAAADFVVGKVDGYAIPEGETLPERLPLWAATWGKYLSGIGYTRCVKCQAWTPWAIVDGMPKCLKH